MELKDKVIVITGGGRGLGRSMALELAGQGAKIALADLNAEDLDVTVGLCMEKGVEARGYIANVADEASVEKLFNDVVADLATLHGLVNNAGVGITGPIEEIPEIEIKANFETNFFGPINVIKSVLPHMRMQ